MIKKIHFCPRYTAEGTVFKNTHAVISITDPDQKDVIIKGTENLLRLKFLDLEAPINHPKFNNHFLFNEEQAKEIHRFILSINEPNQKIDHLIIHCEAGASRSAAVALFAYHLTQADFPKYHDANFANKLVVKTFSNLFSLQIDIPPKIEDKDIILLDKIFK